MVAEGEGGIRPTERPKTRRRRREKEVHGHQQLRRNRDRPRLLEEDPGLEPRRGHEAGDDQLPDAEAREGRALLRAHLRPDQGLGVLLRQVQAGPLQGHRLRALRRRGHPLEGPPRAHGPHRPRRARLPHLVLQGRPEPDRLPDRHGSEGAREGPLLRRLDRHLDRRGGPQEGPQEAREGGQEGPRRLRRRARSSAPRSWPSRSSAASSSSRARAPRSDFADEDELWAEGLGVKPKKLDDADRDEARASETKKALDAEIADTEAYLDDADRAHGARSGRSSRR